MPHRRWSIILIVAALAGVARGQATTRATTQSDAVIIERSAPQVQTRTFDPKNPPPEMPALRPGEAAVTASNFSCATLITAAIENQVPSAQGCTATIRVAAVKTTIKLGITIWLPVNGTKKLTAHEEGHRIIDETFYAGAEQVARDLATAMIGQRRVGQGVDCEAAAQTAIRQAGDEVNTDYMAAIARPATRVQELYDEITDHGRNRIKEAAAIKRATDQQRRETAGEATTRPAQSKPATRLRGATPRGRPTAQGG